jgi:hypothetical protein
MMPFSRNVDLPAVVKRSSETLNWARCEITFRCVQELVPWRICWSFHNDTTKCSVQLSRSRLKWAVFRRFRNIARSDYSLRRVCSSVSPSARMEQPYSHRADFLNEILNLKVIPKYVEIIQVSLKSNKNNGYFTWRPIYICDHISLNYA